MSEFGFILLIIAFVGGALLVQHLYNRATHGEPEHLPPGADGREFGRTFLSSAPELIEVSPDGRVLVQTRTGRKVAFHRSEVVEARARSGVDGIEEVVIDLGRERIVVDVSSRTVQREILDVLGR